MNLTGAHRLPKEPGFSSRVLYLAWSIVWALLGLTGLMLATANAASVLAPTQSGELVHQVSSSANSYIPRSAEMMTTYTFLPLILLHYPPTVQFDSDSYSVHEEDGTAMISVTLSGASQQTVTVECIASDGVARAGSDYAIVGGTLVFPPGEVNQTLNLEIFDDPFDEPEETLTFALSNPTNAAPGTPNSALLTIVDNDTPSSFSIQIAALHQMEPATMGLAQTEAEWLALYESAFVTLTTALKESGAGWTRVRIEWEMIEPNAPEPGQPPDYVWGPYHDVKLRLVAEAGVRLIATVVDSPNWAASVPCGPLYPDRLDEFARFLTDLVNRYKGPPYYIKYWELVNEPDYTEPNGHAGGLGCWGYQGNQYAQMLAVAYPAIKGADPEATVLMGGVAHDWFIEYGGYFYRYFPDRVMENGGGAYIDVLNFHYFPDFHAEWERWDPRSKDQRYDWLYPPNCGNMFDGEGAQYEASGIDLMVKATFFRNRMAVCHGVEKPVWVTELAEHGYPDDPDSLTNQARYIIQGYARGLAAGVENITWYSLDRAPYDPYYQSLLYDDFSPKPAFYAYKALTAELTGYTYSHDRSVWIIDDNIPRGYRYVREAYVFKNASGEEKTVAWGSGRLTFAPADQLRVADREGNVTFIADGGAGDADGAQDGTVELQLTADPVFAQVTSTQ